MAGRPLRRARTNPGEVCYLFFGPDGKKRTTPDKKHAREETRKAGTGIFWEITSSNPDGRPILVGPAPVR